MVRDLLRGSFQNTAFVVFAPDGKTKLTRSGRSPNHAFGKDVFTGMVEISNKYKPQNTLDPARVSDFHSFKQSLNVASADQRLLVLTVAPKSKLEIAKQTISKIFNDEEMSGRFFYDTTNKGDEKWATALKGASKEAGIFIIKPGKYGTSGTVMKELAIDTKASTLKAALTKANTEYAKTEKRKVYSEHVADGKKDGVNYENTMPPGEDRDGDGKIDPKPNRKGDKGTRPRRNGPPPHQH